MAEWKKVLISGSNAHIAQLSASTVPTVDTEDNLVAITSDGHFKQITQANVAAGGFYLEDGDGTEVLIQGGNEVKFVEGSNRIDINWTDTTDGTDADPYDLTFDINANNVFTAIATSSHVGLFTSSYAYSASKVNVTDTTDSATFGMIFAKPGSGDGVELFSDVSDFTYNPSTRVLSIGSGISFDGNTAGSRLVLSNTSNTKVFSGISNATLKLASDAQDLQIGDDGGVGTTKIMNSGSVQGDLTVEGNFTVNGTTTTIDTVNLTVEDRFILLASGSTTNGDGGIIIEKDAGGTGTALFWDQDTKSWSIDFAGVDTSAADPASVDARLVVVEAAAGNPDNSDTNDYPLNGANTNGYGQIWVNTSPATGESGIFIYG